MRLRVVALTVAATLYPITASIALAQIVDRPPAQPRAQSHWGVRASVTPRWWTPDAWGKLFLENVDPNRSITMEGNDWSIGIVRARPLGFEFGISVTKKTITEDYVIPHENFDFFSEGSISAVTYTGLDNVEITGVESHVVIPAGRIGERVQIGVLLGGGLGAVPTVGILETVEGPPFYATCTNGVTGVPLTTLPAGGGFVRDEYGQCLPVAPGSRAGTTTQRFRDIAAMDQVWLFMKTQLAVDFQVAGPLKLRAAGGFNFPSAQFIGVDVVYLFGDVR
jgi:hypothetical protein